MKRQHPESSVAMGRNVSQHGGDGGGIFSGARNSWSTNTLHLGTADGVPTKVSPHLTTTGNPYQDQAKAAYNVSCAEKPLSTSWAMRRNVVTPVGRRSKGRHGSKGEASGSKGRSVWALSHKHQTCKCAVCLQCRGELPATWDNHEKANCACTVCRQARGAASERAKRAGLAPLPHKPPRSSGSPRRKASWLTAFEATEHSKKVCTREPYSEGHHQSYLYPDNSVNRASLVTPRPAFCKNGTSKVPWQPISCVSQLRNSIDHVDCCPVLGTPSATGLSLASSPICRADPNHDQRGYEQTLGFSYDAENLRAEQETWQSNLLSNSSFAGSSHTDSTSSLNFTASDSQVSQTGSPRPSWRQSWESPALISNGCSVHAPCSRRPVEICQKVTGTSTRLQNAEPLHLEARRLSSSGADMWEQVLEKITTCTEVKPIRETDPGPYTNLIGMNKAKLDSFFSMSGSQQEAFHHAGEGPSCFGPYPSSLVSAYVNLAGAPPFPEGDGNAECLSRKVFDSQPCGLSETPFSMAQFPFGLEVQAQAELEIGQLAANLSGPIPFQSMTVNTDQQTTVPASSSFETRLLTSMPGQKDDPHSFMGIIPEGTTDSSGVTFEVGSKKLNELNEVAGEEQAKSELKPGSDDQWKPSNALSETSSKVSMNFCESHRAVKRKGAKRKQVSTNLAYPVPKWRRLVQSKNDYITVKKIYIRTRVPRKCVQRFESMLPEANDDTATANLGKWTLSDPEISDQCLPLDSTAEINSHSSELTDTGASTRATAVLSESLSVSEEVCGVLPEQNMYNPSEREDCSQEPAFPRGKEQFVITPEVKIKDTKMVQELGQQIIICSIPQLQGCNAPGPTHNCTSCTVARCYDQTQKTSEIGDWPSLGDYMCPKCTQDLPMVLSNIVKRSSRPGICAIDDHLGRKAQLVHALTQNILGIFNAGLHSRKISRTEMKTCNKRMRKSVQDNFGQLKLQARDTCRLQQLNGQNDFLSTSSQFFEVESLFKVDPARVTDVFFKLSTLTSNFLLDQSARVLYLTHMCRNRTSNNCVVQLTGLGRSRAFQCPTSSIIECLSWIGEGCRAVMDNRSHTQSLESLYCRGSLHLVYIIPVAVLFQIWNLLSSLGATSLVAWLKVLSGLRIHCFRNIMETNGGRNARLDILCGPIPRSELWLDSEALRRFSFITANFSHLPHNKLTIFVEDQLSYKERPCSSSRSMRRQYSVLFSWDIGQNEVNGFPILKLQSTPGPPRGTKTQQERNNAIVQHQQSYHIHKIGGDSFRDLVSPFCPRALYGSKHCATTGRQFRVDTAGSPWECDDCKNGVTGDKEQTYEAKNKLVPLQCLTCEKGIQRRRQKLGAGMSSNDLDEVDTLHGNTQQSRMLCSIRSNTMPEDQSPTAPGQTQLSTPGERAMSTEGSCQQTPPASSFQELLKSVLQVSKVPCPPLMSSCLSWPASSQPSREICCGNSSPTTPDLDKFGVKPVLTSECKASSTPRCNLATDPGCSTSFMPNQSECRASSTPGPNLPTDPRCSTSFMPNRSECQTSSTPRPNLATDPGCSTCFVPNLVRKRGCPKGGWPTKGKPKKFKMGPPCFDWAKLQEASMLAIKKEPEFEVLHPTRVKTSKMQENEYQQKLETFLQKPFEMQELKNLEELASVRKPLLRLRESRRRVLHVATRRDGMSYLDYHPDLARQLADAGAPIEKLTLLRGFFFWVQHSCMSGSFKPWAPHEEEKEESHDDDCVVIFPEGGVVEQVQNKAKAESKRFEHSQATPQVKIERHMILRPRARKKKYRAKPAVKAKVRKEAMKKVKTERA